MVTDGDPTRGGLLDLAISAGHRALARLEDDDVPARLRAVRSASIKHSLPPPLGRQLVAALDQEWLRELAMEELEAGDSLRHRAARLFLGRPAGWEEELGSMEQAMEGRADRAEVERLRAEVERLEQLVGELSARLTEAESRAETAEGAARDEVEERLARFRKVVADLEQRVATRAAEIERANRLLDRAQRDLADADARIASLRVRAAPDRPAGEGSAGDAPSLTFGRGSPLDTARLLDHLVEVTRPRRAGETVAPTRQALALPPGVRPDSPAAIDWIGSIGRPVHLLVDGHNVALELEDDPDRSVRDRIVLAVARIRRLAEGPVLGVVFFDTTGVAESQRNWGVSVRYVPDADDAIEEHVRRAEAECVVVSTDREVRRRAQEHGAVTLWGTAFSAWMSSR